MERVRRPSPQTVAVLLALMDDPTGWRYGYDLSQELDLKPGTLYPILMRLADRGLLETAWEKWEDEAPRGRIIAMKPEQAEAAKAQVTIRWPSGKVQTVEVTAVDDVLEVQEPSDRKPPG